MYRLLLVTDQQNVRDTFTGIQSWEGLGFKTPRTVASCAEAVSTLEKHHADVIALALSDPERQKMMTALEEWPDLPIMEATDRENTLIRNIHEAEQVLIRLNSDYSNDRYDLHEQMMLARHEYFRKILFDENRESESIRRHLMLVRSHMDPSRECVLMSMHIDGVTDYLEERWHYGIDRLEVAIRNIFGAEKHGMRMLLSMTQGDGAYLVGCPMLGTGEMDEKTMVQITQEHASDGISHVSEFIGLTIHQENTMVLHNLTELSSAARKLRVTA